MPKLKFKSLCNLKIYIELAGHEILALTLVIGRAPKNNCVEFGPVNEWCFDEESWPGPRTGEVSARKGG